MGDSKRVLVTGSAGGVGMAVCAALIRSGHHVSGFDRRETPDISESIVGDVTDRQAVYEAMADRDAVIHLAATPDEADFLGELLEPNVRGLFHVCDAARKQEVPRIILASSIQVISGFGWRDMVRLEDGPRVINHYALTKLWAEQMGEMYARFYRHTVIAVRLGWLPRSVEHALELQASPFGPDIFFSHDDAGRFFNACVEVELAERQFEVIFGTSVPAKKPLVDLQRSKELLGYEPQDTWPEGLPFTVEP